MQLYTYNVLASAYIKPSFYPSVSPKHLQPMWRIPALAARVQALDADLLCLQEVDAITMEMLRLALPGHRGEYAQKSQGRPDGCATFVRQSLPLESARAFHYSDNTSHVALLTILRDRTQRIGVANTHLKWSPDGEHAHYQLRELVQQLDRSIPWVVCGDFNVDATSAAIAFMREAGLIDSWASAPADTCNSNHKKKRIDFILHTPELRVELSPITVVEDETPLPREDEPSDHVPLGVDLRTA